jgi:TonB-linked SusC/RagA family outer membrane protein
MIISYIAKPKSKQLMQIKILHAPLTIFCLLLTCAMAIAQTGSITGKVVDAKNQPVSFATVALKGTTNGTASDIDGKFEFDNLTAGDYTVVVSFVGYKDFSQTVSVGSTATDVNVQLVQDYQSLNEVVVVGYGTKKVKDLTGSVTSVSTKDFLNGNVATPEQLIQGKVAGVQITQNGGAPGSGSTIRIRGGSSLNASNDPLIVIDGVPIDNDGIAGASSGLDLINPNDIENITVLKDASAAAIYGSRAANGVIMITTKKGNSSKLHIEFSTNNSISTNIGYVSTLNGDQFRTAVDSFGNSAQKALLGTNNTNWQSLIYRNSFSTDNDLAFTGGIKNLPYRLSLEYLNNNGILLRNQLQRGSIGLNLSPTFLNNSLKVNLHYKFSYNYNNFSSQGAIGTAVYFDPTQTLYNDTSKFGGYFEWLSKGNLISLAPKNPVGQIYEKNDISHVYENIGNLELNYTLPFLPELHADLNVGGDLANSNGTVVIPLLAATNYNAKHPDSSGLNNYYSEEKQNKLLEFYLNYNKDFKSIKSTIDLTAGYSYQSWWTESPNYPTLSYSKDTIGLAAPFPSEYENVLISFYGRLNYTLAEKYLLTLTLRDDGSSRFAPADRWGLFPIGSFRLENKRRKFCERLESAFQFETPLGLWCNWSTRYWL